MLERAQFKSKRSIASLSPFYFFISDLGPASAAYWQCLVLVVNVEFNVAVGALAVPRVSTSLSHFYLTTPQMGEVCSGRFKILW